MNVSITVRRLDMHQSCSYFSLVFVFVRMHGELVMLQARQDQIQFLFRHQERIHLQLNTVYWTIIYKNHEIYRWILKSSKCNPLLFFTVKTTNINPFNDYPNTRNSEHLERLIGRESRKFKFHKKNNVENINLKRKNYSWKKNRRTKVHS